LEEGKVRGPNVPGGGKHILKTEIAKNGIEIGTQGGAGKRFGRGGFSRVER